MNNKAPVGDVCKSTKVAIIGVGSVGATTAYSLMLAGDVSQIVLFDKDLAKAEGIALDLMHGSPFTAGVTISGTNSYNDLTEVDIFIVTAGARQHEGQTRLDLANTNKALLDGLIPELLKASPHALFIMVTNPVDVLTHHVISKLHVSPGRVFGTGTMLDTARFREHLAEALSLSSKSIDAYIMGEHGDSSFPVVSASSVAGIPLPEYPGMSQKIIDECFEKTRTAAYRIIHDVGFTCYSIATVLKTIVRAITHDTHEIFMLSTLLNNYEGISDVCLSVPTVLGKSGIVKTITLPLSKDEVVSLKKSSDIVKKLLI